MISALLFLSLLLTQVPLAEITSEGNAIGGGYCETVCDATSVTVSDGTMMFGPDRSSLISYTSTSGSEGTMTLEFECDVPDGTGMRLEYLSYGKLHSVEGEFRNGECTIELHNIRSTSITEIYGDIDCPGEREVLMTIHTVDGEGNRSVWNPE
jgi:hypothetical protein